MERSIVKLVFFKAILAICLSFCFNFNMEAQRYTLKKGKIDFTSDAPLEVIKGSTSSFKTVLQCETNQLGVSIMMASFQGFNSTLQQDHYNENYLETNKYPEAKFVGKIIEDISLQPKTKQTVRAKGKFSLHGQTVEKTILCTLMVQEDKTIQVVSDFEINLSEFNIIIPTIVHKKIAENIKIHLQATLVTN